VATMMGFVARFLAENPEARHYLAGHPDRIAKSLDELLRRHSMTAGGRTVRVDTELDGVHLKAGDRVLQPTMLHGLDDRRFPDPMTVDFQRANAKAMGTFGSGPHRCPGANLARGELRIFIEEWLVRIPDFAMDPDEPPMMASGMVSAILKLPLVWGPATTKG
jgi:cytochrome P450